MKEKCPVTCGLCDADKSESEDTTTWQKAFNGNGADDFNSLVNTSDGYVAVGYSSSSNITGITNKGSYDAVIVKYDLNGNVIWQKNWGGSSDDFFRSVVKEEDGYVVVGWTSSTNISGLPNKGKSDAVIVKFDLDGNLIWQKSFATATDDWFTYLISVQDGYIVTGLYSRGLGNAYLIKYSKDGTKLWEKTYNKDSGNAFDTIVASNDGYIVVGWSSQNNRDALIVKYDFDGNIIWQKNWGGNGLDEFDGITIGTDGYIAVGLMQSTNISGITNKGTRNAMIVKYDFDGNMLWQKSWGGNGSNDYFHSVVARENMYVAVGYTNSTDLSGLANKGGLDAMIVKYDLSGNILSQKNFGGNGTDNFNFITSRNDKYVIVGSSNSNNISGLANKGSLDAIILKYNSELLIAD